MYFRSNSVMKIFAYAGVQIVHTAKFLFVGKILSYLKNIELFKVI